MRRASLALAIALFPALVGCGTQQEAEPQTITLTRGSTLSLSTSTDGKTDIVATVPTGSVGAGTYTSSDLALVDDARDAKNALNEPGVSIAIIVDAKGRIVGVQHTRTK